MDEWQYGYGDERLEHPDIWEFTQDQEDAFNKLKARVESHDRKIVSREYQDDGMIHVTFFDGRHNHYVRINKAGEILPTAMTFACSGASIF